MLQSGRASYKNLIYLGSLILLGILFLANVIVSFVLQIPFQDPTEDTDIYQDVDDAIFQLCSNDLPYLCLNDTIGVDDNVTCPCAIQFSPIKWGFLMHIFSYLLSAGAISFLILNIFRTSRDTPPVLSLVVSICFNLTFVFHLAWLFLWDQGHWTASAILLLLATLTSWTSVVIFSINLSQESADLHHNAFLDLWVYRIVVQNALAVQATWTLLLLLINFSIALVDDANVKDPQSSEANIIILTFIVAIWTPLEIMVWDKIFRYMMTPFIVIIWTLTGIYTRLQSDHCHDATVRVFTLILLIIVIVVLVGRILFTIFRHLRKPLEKNQ